MDQFNSILQSWGVMIAYLPWILGFALILLVFITWSLASISGSLKNIAAELKKAKGANEVGGTKKIGSGPDWHPVEKQ